MSEKCTMLPLNTLMVVAEAVPTVPSFGGRAVDPGTGKLFYAVPASAFAASSAPSAAPVTKAGEDTVYNGVKVPPLTHPGNAGKELDCSDRDGNPIHTGDIAEVVSDSDGLFNSTTRRAKYVRVYDEDSDGDARVRFYDEDGERDTDYGNANELRVVLKYNASVSSAETANAEAVVLVEVAQATIATAPGGEQFLVVPNS